MVADVIRMQWHGQCAIYLWRNEVLRVASVCSTFMWLPHLYMCMLYTYTTYGLCICHLCMYVHVGTCWSGLQCRASWCLVVWYSISGNASRRWDSVSLDITQCNETIYLLDIDSPLCTCIWASCVGNTYSMMNLLLTQRYFSVPWVAHTCTCTSKVRTVAGTVASVVSATPVLQSIYCACTWITEHITALVL